MFERVLERPRAVGEIAMLLPVSRPAVSQHLRALKEAGLVHESRDGTRRIYRAEAAPLEALRAYLDELCRTAATTG